MRRGIASSILAVTLVAAPARGAVHEPAAHDPRQFPSCADIDSIAIAYRDAFMKQGATLRPENLLYGPTILWAIAPTPIRGATER